MLASEKFNQSVRAHALMGKTSQTLLCIALLAGAPYVIPGLHRWQLLSAASRGVMTQTAEPSSNISVVAAPASATIPASVYEVKPGEVEDVSGKALLNFFRALERAENKTSRAVISHYGDSPITNDGITSTVRRKLQERFGDAGHGFVLAGKAWNWYEHAGVKHFTDARWKADPMWIARGEHLYGLGGAAFTANTAGASATFGSTDEGSVGRAVSAFDIYFLAQPGGGEFNVEVDGRSAARVSTKSETKQSAFHRIAVEPGAHTMTLRTVGNGEVRLFGVVLDNGTSGVQYDSLGNNGAFVGLLANYLDENHWAEQLQHRRPDLVILGYGTNESEFENWPMQQYERDTREAIRRIRAALPDASILLFGPMDRGKRQQGGGIITRPTIPKLVVAQRRFAAENGCAFFDTFTAMGGEGTVARWREARPRLMGGDFTHPTAEGAEIVGTLLHDALIRSYEKYRQTPDGSQLALEQKSAR